MAKKQIFEERKLTGFEAKRRFDDKAASIDSQIQDSISGIDFKRKNEAEKDIVSWVKTYCIGLLLDDIPSSKGDEVLREMDQAWNTHKNYNILMGRGQGKSSFMLCVALKNLLTKDNQNIVIISNNAKGSSGLLKDIFRAIEEKESALSQDYPLVIPFNLCNGSYRRRMTYQGNTINLEKNSINLTFPRLEGITGSENNLTVRSISGAIRGIRCGIAGKRPSVILLDDLQDADIAQSEEQVEKLMNLLKKDIMNLGGAYSERLTIIQTATIIQPDDYIDRLLKDKNWITQKFESIIRYPKNMKLWEQYFEIWNNENTEGENHDESLKFYRDNFTQMNEGSEVFNPRGYHSSDGHISAIQKLLEIREMIGTDNFNAEYQNKPKKYSLQLEITPKDVIEKQNQYHELEIPDGFTSVYASSDLNLATHITTTIIAYKRDMTAVLLSHFITKSNIANNLTEIDYNQQTYQKLIEVGKHIKELGIKVDGWGIDANGIPFDAVTSFCKNSISLCGLKAVGMTGRASKMFSPFVKSRLRDSINGTVLCGDSKEQIKSGTGKKWLVWNSDEFKVKVQKSLLAPVLSMGSLSLYHGLKGEHDEYANQICGEKLKLIKHKSNGQDEYYWKMGKDNHYLDSTAQNFALASSQGISGNDLRQIRSNSTVDPDIRNQMKRKMKRRIRFV